jgi:PAS domain-containing protein
VAGGGHGRSSAGAPAGDGAARAELLADATRRQPLLAAINMGAALLLASGLAGVAPTSALAGWLGCVALAQAARLEVWRRWRRAGADRPGPGPLLTLASGLAGAAWGLAGPLLGGSGDPAQQLLVPFALAGMAAGAVPALPAHPPAFHAFVLAALLPYAAGLALAGDGPGSGTMALLTLAYAAGLSALAGQAHRSLRRSVELNLENGRLIGELEAARGDLERRDERRTAELDALMATVPVSVWFVHDPEGRRITGNPHAARQLRIGTPNHSLSAGGGEGPRHFRILKEGREITADQLPLQRAARGETVLDEEVRVVFDDGAFFDELISAAPVRDAGGRAVGAVGAAVDITNRKRAEEALRLSEQRFRDFAASASDWFWETDAEHRFVWMSVNVEQLAACRASGTTARRGSS